MGRPWVQLYVDELDAPALADPCVRGWWLTLRALADQTHPTAAPIPRRIPDDVVLALEAAGLLVMAPGDLFRMPAVDTIHEARSAQARSAVSARRDRQGKASKPPRPTPVERPYNGSNQPSDTEQSRAAQQPTAAAAQRIARDDETATPFDVAMRQAGVREEIAAPPRRPGVLVAGGRP